MPFLNLFSLTSMYVHWHLTLSKTSYATTRLSETELTALSLIKLLMVLFLSYLF